MVRAALRRYPAAGRLWVGYSGGLDSSVLLHILAREQVPVAALHIHHGLSALADHWQQHCAASAGALGVPFTSVAVAVDRSGGGLEEGARRARYQAFVDTMGDGDVILLGHHGDDQVETFLLRLLRGAGVAGLASMPAYRSIGEGKHLLRPLLHATRTQLEAYARDHGVTWIEDDSNRSLNLDRNYLRSEVTPRLAARWPVAETVARVAENLQEADGLLEEVAGEDLQGCDPQKERVGWSLALEPFARLSLGRRKNLLRHWVRAQCGQAPEAAQLEQLFAQLAAAVDALPEVRLAGCVARRFRNRLHLTPQLQPLDLTGEAGGVWKWDGKSDLALPGGWVLSPSADWPAADYRIRFRRGGERTRPRERQHSQTLKKLLQEYALEPWLRDRVPLVYRGEELLAVGDLFVTASGPSQVPIWRFLD